MVASGLHGAFPFADGWGMADELDRTLPPFHIWVTRALGGDLAAARSASFLEGALALGVVVAWSAWRHGVATAAAALLLALLWPTTLTGSDWGVAWFELATSGRYDMAGVLWVAILAASLDMARDWNSPRAWFIAGVVGGLGLLAHAVYVPALLAAAGWCLWRYRKTLVWWLSGVVVGMTPLFSWVVSGWAARAQLLAQLDRGRMLVPGAVSEIDRWSPLWLEPDVGGIALVVVGLSAALLGRGPAGFLVVGSWILTSLLDSNSGGNYALIVLCPLAVGALDLVTMARARAVPFALVPLAALLLLGAHRATSSAFDSKWLDSSAPTLLADAVSPDDRLLVQMKHWPLVQQNASVVPYFVMQWQRRPEDARTLSERLDDWCPTLVVRSKGAWPFHIVREGWGGPELGRWLDEAVVAWVPVPIAGYDEAIEVGRVDSERCFPPR